MTNAHRRSFFVVACVSLILAVSGGARAKASPPSILGYGETAIATLGPRLPEVAQAYGLTTDQLIERLRADLHLGVDLDLKLFYSEATLADFAAQSTDPEDAAAPALEGLAPLENTFLLHSRPGSQRVVYLDFDGHVLSGTVWNDSYSHGADIVCPAWDIGGGASVFTAAERTIVQQVWQRVAEDYAPFDVDVTTEYPGEAAITRSNSADAFYGMRVLISPIHSYVGSYGGIAYVGVFNMVGDYYKPALVFPEMLANGDKYIGEASSHENGHTLGLFHDGITGGAEYYQGHGTGDTSWAPIMGNGYYKNLTQWSKGEYSGANNHEDDLARMLTYGLSYRADDCGDSAAAATPLPAGSNPTASGFIGRTGDSDVFSFTAGAGPVTVAAAPAPAPVYLGPNNLDILLELRDAGGTVLASNNPVDALAANLSTTVAAGTYYITVTGTGKGDPLTGYSNYASLGAYTLSATLVLPSAAPTITLTSPNGGESWANGPPAHDVTWTLSSAVSVGEFRSWIIDGAGNWVAALTSVAAVPGQTNYSVPWTVAAPARADYTMVLYYRADPSVWVWQAMDQSNGPFTVTGVIPTITLTSPNGGESWANGPPAHDVTWTLSSAVSVGEFRSWIIDGAGNWVAALTSVAAVPGQTNYSVPWTVAAPARADYTMVLYYRADPSVWVWQAMDQSNGPFTVTGVIPTITLTSPNGGESWANGPPAHDVTWTLSSAVSVGEFRSWIIDGAGNWVAALTSVAAVPGQTSYSVPWTVAAPARADYTMVLYYRADPSVWVWQAMDQSNGPFTVN